MNTTANKVNTGVDTPTIMNANETNLKATAAVIGIVAVGWLTVEALISFLWLCYYAGIRM